MKTATLFIEGWSSHCGACGGNAKYSEDRHVHGGPNKATYRKESDSHLDQTNGCRALFVDKDGEGAHVLRPDLPFSPERIARNKQAFDQTRACRVVRSDGTVEEDWEWQGDTPGGERSIVRKWSDDHGDYLNKFPSKELFSHWQDGGTARGNWEIPKENA